MLKPTERPPASLQPRFAASITPGPPPVTTANPASAKIRAVSRARRYGSVCRVHAGGAEIVTAGRWISRTSGSPQELRRDHRDVVGEVFVRALEDALVVHQSRFCSTCAATIPSTSRTISPP